MYHNNEISIINLSRLQCIVSVLVSANTVISVQILVSEISVKSGIGPSLVLNRDTCSQLAVGGFLKLVWQDSKNLSACLSNTHVSKQALTYRN